MNDIYVSNIQSTFRQWANTSPSNIHSQLTTHLSIITRLSNFPIKEKENEDKQALVHLLREQIPITLPYLASFPDTNDAKDEVEEISTMKPDDISEWYEMIGFHATFHLLPLTGLCSNSQLCPDG